MKLWHWLFLRHIWGDDDCGDDLEADTPDAEEANYGCPNFPHKPNNNCGGDADGEMFMNFMDYVDDNCMNMFTLGQGQRAYSAINNFRSDLLNSQGCQPVSIEQQNLNYAVDVFPNPSNGNIQIKLASNMMIYQLEIIDLAGKLMYSSAVNNNRSVMQINLSNQLNAGVYMVRIVTENGVAIKKISIQ